MSKTKLNFAEKVRPMLSAKSDSDGSRAQQRAIIQAEINSRPVSIDRSVFQKTEQEKEELRIEKAHWKKLNP